MLLRNRDAWPQTPKPMPAPGLQKRSKEKIGYRDQPYEGRSCGKCVLYAGDGECVIVEGKVSVDGWCPQWTPATMGRRAGFASV
ncbi:MAG: high-potential iron-sulfur protein [Betaproteobacteria bacterium]